MASKWKILKYIGIALTSVLVLLLIWGVVIEPRLINYQNEEARIPDLPATWEGKRIALIADLQIGMWLDNEGTVDRIVKRIVAEQPAAVLIAGDFIYHPAGDDSPEEERRNSLEESDEVVNEIRQAINHIRPLLDAKIPVYAVLGNHDYAMEYPDSVKLQWIAEELAKNLRENGVIVLQNEAVQFEMSGSDGNIDSMTEKPFYLVGIGSVYANNSNPSAALSGVPADAPRVVFMHNPDSFAEIPANAAPLALAGHTHGGQIRIPFLPEWSWMAMATKSRVTSDGWINDYGQPGNHLYVNVGIGFSLVPIRINCRPELTMITMHKK